MAWQVQVTWHVNSRNWVTCICISFLDVHVTTNVSLCSRLLKSVQTTAFLKIPVIKQTTLDCSALPLYDSRCFTNKEIIGNGVYSGVFTADIPFTSKHGKANATVKKTVVKKMLSDDVLDKKTFIKEARILQRLKHPNIADFKGICNNPFALVLEYVYFDFKPFRYLNHLQGHGSRATIPAQKWCCSPRS